MIANETLSTKHQRIRMKRTISHAFNNKYKYLKSVVKGPYTTSC